MFYLNSNFSLRFKDDALLHIVNANIDIIQVSNTFNRLVTILRRMRFESLYDYEKKECYLTFLNNAHLAADQ